MPISGHNRSLYPAELGTQGLPESVGKPRSMTSDIDRLRTVAAYVRKPFYEYGRAKPEDLYACVQADLLTMEEAREAGL